MRIISGLYRGKKLKSPLDHLTRPTTDRVKESLFNILSNFLSFQDINVLDLFAGSGALGIEAISRGAKKATFVENHYDAFKILKENTLPCQPQCSVMNEDVLKFLTIPPLYSYDLIFMDPPYGKISIDLLLEKIKKHQWLKTQGVIVIETQKDTPHSKDFFFLKDHRIYGKTALWFLEG